MSSSPKVAGWLAVGLALGTPLPNDARAVQLPRIISSEKRFRAYVYNPNEVYRYIGHYLSQSYIEFEEGERVQTISMGDTTSWQTVVMDNKLFLKPVLNFANTNMTIMTNRRTYHFELDALESASVMEDDVLFYIKFMYPETAGDKNIVILDADKKRNDLPDLRNLEAYNFDYEFSGSESIAPLKVFDDGEFTYMEFNERDSRELPAIYSVDSEGYESMVNYRIVENYIVIEQLASQFTLRSSSDIVCVYNNNLFRLNNAM
ncbi:MAG: TrbG/VirB9 family P-type conjugative transfer protein [Rickettsiales bacterium]|jgi:type IV secretion system protein VirB9|nr:TrbG/VirB9 family P-type conjugative transfer protein [Rickettsiales bacterium]